jgi:hypothetical protein
LWSAQRPPGQWYCSPELVGEVRNRRNKSAAAFFSEQSCAGVPDEGFGVAAAVEFKLSDEQRKRVVVQERD